jgi:hypothetical protein
MFADRPAVPYRYGLHRDLRTSTMQISRWLAIAILSLTVAVPALADDIRPEARTQVDRPMADEKCIEKCDTQSDKCMQDSGGDSGKVQACDDKYSECLKSCEGGG